MSTISEAKDYTTSEVLSIFRSDLSKKALHNAEAEKRIPTAPRVSRGAIGVRRWPVSDLPEIGKLYGFLNAPKSQKVISCYFGKGGVLKTTVAFTFARSLALNGIKTIVIGLDVSQSITTLCLEPEDVTNINQIKSRAGLYDVIFGTACDVDEIIMPTDLPTLHVIPETSSLNLLEKRLRDVPRRESVFDRELIPALSDYDVIIFDNSPSWNLLIENSLSASKYVIAPISCEAGTYMAVDENTEILLEFKKVMDIEWSDYINVPTLCTNSKISTEIHAAFISNYSDNITTAKIRRTVKGQESSVYHQSIFEYAPKSDLAMDYFLLIKEIWERINK